MQTYIGSTTSGGTLVTTTTMASTMVALFAVIYFLLFSVPAYCGSHSGENLWNLQLASDRARCAPYGLDTPTISAVSQESAHSAVFSVRFESDEPPREIMCEVRAGRSSYYERSSSGDEWVSLNICEPQAESDTRYHVGGDTVDRIAEFAYEAVRSIKADSSDAPPFYASDATGGPSSLSIQSRGLQDAARLRVISAQAQRVEGRLYHLLVSINGSEFYRWRIWEHPSEELELVMAKSVEGPKAVDISVDDPDGDTEASSHHFYAEHVSSGYLQDRERLDRLRGHKQIDDSEDIHHVSVGEILLEEEVAEWMKGELPASFDMRNPPESHAHWKECLLPKKRQGDCGSCYALASARAFGERLCIRTRGRVKMWPSVQQQKDCSQMSKDPCHSGVVWPNAIASMSNVGAIPETYFPYSVPRFYQSTRRCKASNAWELRFNTPTDDASPMPLTFRNADPTKYPRDMPLVINFKEEAKENTRNGYSRAITKMLKSLYSFGPVVWVGMWKNRGLANHAVTLLGWKLTANKRLELIIRNSNVGRFSNGYEEMEHSGSAPLRWPEEIYSFMPDVPSSPADWPYTLQVENAAINQVHEKSTLSLTMQWAAPEYHSEYDWAVLEDKHGHQVGDKVRLGSSAKQGSITFEGLPQPSDGGNTYTAYLFAAVKKNYPRDDLMFKSHMLVETGAAGGLSVQFVTPEDGWGGEWNNYSAFPRAYDPNRSAYLAVTPEITYAEMVTRAKIPDNFASLAEYYQAISEEG